MTDPSSLPPSGSLLPDVTMRPRDVAALQLHLPTFWRNNPQLWFAQVEATFDFHHISSEISRFLHLLCNLSPEMAQVVTDVIAAPLNDASYQRLKQSILYHTTTSESARLRHLLTSEELGARHPSQLLNSMRQLLRSSDVGSNRALFRELFLQRLPQSFRLVLVAAWELTVDHLAQLANRVHDATSATVTALSSTLESSVVSRLESRIDQLAASIDSFRISPHDQHDPASVTHVLLRRDAVKAPLTPSYDGSYHVLHRTPKSTTILNGREEVVSLDRLKQAYLETPPHELQADVANVSYNGHNVLTNPPLPRRRAGGPVETTDAAARGTLALVFSAGACTRGRPGTRQLVLEAYDAGCIV
ncbi:hypothetical protein HPB50_006444 [Hyalomma asiaticum]|uniref:Uncharacterized protein n=1 Tax=Hyalomma asiaticum TaxID=266040 RepID=A0ACB7SIK8_HYAAI|nr:hypothetical protein HPB50_006444 [Hyalomma asiaticum]